MNYSLAQILSVFSGILLVEDIEEFDNTIAYISGVENWRDIYSVDFMVKVIRPYVLDNFPELKEIEIPHDIGDQDVQQFVDELTETHGDNYYLPTMSAAIWP